MAEKLKQDHGMQMNQQPSPPQHHQQHLQSPNYNLNMSQGSAGGFMGPGGQNPPVGYTIGNLLAIPQNSPMPSRTQKGRVKGTKRANKEAKVQNGAGEYSEEENGVDKKIGQFPGSYIPVNQYLPYATVPNHMTPINGQLPVGVPGVVDYGGAFQAARKTENQEACATYTTQFGKTLTQMAFQCAILNFSRRALSDSCFILLCCNILHCIVF